MRIGKAISVRLGQVFTAAASTRNLVKLGIAIVLLSVFVQPVTSVLAAESPKIEYAKKLKVDLDTALRNEDQDIFPKLDAFSEAQKPLLRIRLNDTFYQAASVYFGQKIEGRFQCSTIYKDDTIH